MRHMSKKTIENSDITRMAREALAGNWSFAAIAVLIHITISIVIAAAPTISDTIPEIAGNIIPHIIAGPFFVGFAYFYLKTIRNNKMKISYIFKGFSIFTTSFAANFMITIFTLLWTLLFIIPGIMKAYSYSMTFFILSDNPEKGAMNAISESKEIMYGNRWKLFCLSGRFFAWSIVCLFTLGLGFLALLPYMGMSFACFYEQVKNESETPQKTIEEDQSEENIMNPATF